jgi:HAD superfamily hydrolase (TIGR01509 family)
LEDRSISAVIFDLDGLLIDSEEVWDAVRERLVRERSGRWHDRAQQDMMGMSSLEWSRYMHDELGLADDPAEINAEVVRRMEKAYRERLPLVSGAREAVQRLADRWPLGLASSSNRPLIDLVLELAGLVSLFRATVSSEEVGRGKPAPDVYLEAARRLGIDPGEAAAIEDSGNGIRSARAAGMRVVAIPNPSFPPRSEALAEADVVLASLDELTPEAVDPDIVPVVSTRQTVDDLLADARRRLHRLTPQEAFDAAQGGAVLVDTRSEDERREQECRIPGALHYPLSVVLWRLDPTTAESGAPKLELDTRLIVICRHGYSSSLAAVWLQEIGFSRATDVIGGVAGWLEAGLPVEPCQTPA